MIGPWGPLGRGLNLYIEFNGEKFRVSHISETRGRSTPNSQGIYTHYDDDDDYYYYYVLPEVFATFGVVRSREVPAAGRG